MGGSCELVAKFCTDNGIIELLVPLTSAAELPTHPSLAVPYHCSTLTDMAQQACEMVHREKKTLWNVKSLLTKLRGDQTWVPCGELCSDVDDVIFGTEWLYNGGSTAGLRGDHPGDSEIKAGNDKLQAYAQDGSPSDVGVDVAVQTTKVTSRDPDPDSQIGENQININKPINPLEVDEDAISNRHSAIDTKEIGPEVVETQAADAVNTPMEDPESKDTTTALRDPDNADRIAGDHETSQAPVLISSVVQLSDQVAAVVEGTNTDAQMIDNGARAQANHSPNPQVAKSVGDAKSPLEDTVASMDSHETQMKPKDFKDALPIDGEEVDDESQPAPRRMRTRAQAQAVSENTTSTHTRSVSPASWTPPLIHPLYLMSPSAYPDRDIGLPANEAEETRRILMLYVQKQEEVCRGAEELYEGLLKADRMRKTVLKWCKAEGHVGEMSDGEDWYDKEEWGLEEDLRKGHDDDDDDNNIATQGKKTRGRRAI